MNEETDCHGRPMFLPVRDRKGKPIPIHYPEGATVAVCNRVVAIQTHLNRFAIVHNYETLLGLELEQAAAEFGIRAMTSVTPG